MNNSLAAGDEITPFAWELKDEVVGTTSGLTDDPKTRSVFVDGVPDGPLANSDGGHDIERALYETIGKIKKENQKPENTIILLLMKDDQSQGPNTGTTQLMGTDNKELTKNWKNGPWDKPTRKQFQFESDKGSLTVYVTALFPKKLVSLPDAPDTPRYPTFARSTWQPPADAPVATEQLPNRTGPDMSPRAVSVTGPGTIQVVKAVDERHGFRWWILGVFALVIIAIVVFMAMGKKSGVQRPLQPAVAAAPIAPKVETLPGSLRITIGPDEQTLAPLTKGSEWSLSRQPDGIVKLVDISGPASDGATVPVPVPAASLAKLSFGEDRSLHADADGGAQFAELQGTAADKCNSRALVVEPGKRVLCRVQPPDAASKTRLEIVYDTQVGKGSRV